MGFFRRHAPARATIETDRWTLLNAEDRVRLGETLYWIPPRAERERLHRAPGIGGLAKLLFQLRVPGDDTAVHLERMWVTIGLRTGDFYHGHLVNEPHLADAPIAYEASVWFRAEHVMDYSDAEGDARASDSADTVRCDQHGVSVQCFVCIHLCESGESMPYYLADEPDDARPDAWCEVCEVEGWDAHADPASQIKLLCAGCYDAVLDRHQRGVPQ